MTLLKKTNAVLLLLVMVVPAVSIAIPIPQAHAANGDLVGTVNFDQPCASGVGVGVTFDGKYLWYSCFSSPTDLYRANATTGHVIASYSIDGGLGALAYDTSRNAIWAAWGGGTFGTNNMTFIQLNSTHDVVSSNVAFSTPQVAAIDLDDGLGYDGQNDTLYVSPDTSTVIYHYKTDGTFLNQFNWAGNNCYNSGLAIGGQLLYEGSDGCSQVWVVNKTSTNTVLFNFTTQVAGDPNFRDEGLSCDDKTFGKDVMWSMEAYEPRRAHAFEIPDKSCGVGGQPPANQPPDCTLALPSQTMLWPPNHKMQNITINGVTDPDGDNVGIKITSIFQDEPVKGGGSGNTSPDGGGVGTDTAQIRAERDGTADGRTYHIGFEADDGKGGMCTGNVLVIVPHDQSTLHPEVDQGAIYNSTAP